eukprot:6536392-Prorocentrum_lima.AAC.1
MKKTHRLLSELGAIQGQRRPLTSGLCGEHFGNLLAVHSSQRQVEPLWQDNTAGSGKAEEG